MTEEVALLNQRVNKLQGRVDELKKAMESMSNVLVEHLAVIDTKNDESLKLIIERLGDVKKPE